MRLLVVEHDLTTSQRLRRGLTEEGYLVDSCGDGPEAVSRARAVGYDAVVLDVRLPGEDGFAVCRRLRGEHLNQPVIMLTARHDIADLVRGLDAGADDYLTKPFSFVELAARLRALLRRADPMRTSPLRCGDLWLDVAGRRARRGTTELSLSLRELALLELFLRHPGEIISRTQIRERVWNSAFGVESNVVDQYVSHLRRKIDRPFGRRDIETVRGVGYRLRPNEI